MKKWIYGLLGLVLVVGVAQVGPSIITTAFTRIFLRSPDAATAVALLGLEGGGGSATNYQSALGIGPDSFTPDRPLHIKTELGTNVVGPTIIQENTNAPVNARSWFNTIGTSVEFPTASKIWGFFYDGFTQTNRLMGLDTNGVLTVTGSVSSPSFNDGSDIRGDINEKVGQTQFQEAYDTVVRNDITNNSAAINALRVFWREAPIVHLTNSTVQVDWNASNVFNLKLTNHLTVTEINIPAAGFKSGGVIDVHAEGGPWDLGVPERWSSNPVLPLPALQPGQHITIWFWNWEDEDTHASVGRYSSEGDQALQLPPIYGGTGNPGGAATTPRYITFYPTAFSANTNWYAEHSRGTEAIVWLTDDMHFIGSDGKPVTTNETTEVEYSVHNFSGFDLNFSARADWYSAGFGATWPYVISNGTTLYFKTKAHGPSETNLVVRNLLPTSLVSGGGGSSPPSTLSDGLLFHLTMEDGSDTVATNWSSGGANYNFTPLNVARTTVGNTGQIGLCWTNGVGGAATSLTNSHVDLRVPAAGQRTYAWWMYRTAPSFCQPLVHGLTSGGANYGWFSTINGGLFKFAYSVNGTSYTSELNFGDNWTSTTGVWEFWVLGIDNVGLVAKASKDGADFKTITLSAAINTPAVALSWMGSSTGGQTSSGWFDDFGGWSRILTLSEVEELHSLTNWTVLHP